MIEKVFHLFKIIKEYFTDTRIRLKKLDTALVIRENGTQELYTPKLPEEDIVPENMLILTSIAFNLRDEKWMNDTIFKFTEELDNLKEGVKLGSTETGNSLPDSWAGHDTSTNTSVSFDEGGGLENSKSSPDFLHFIEREKAADALKRAHDAPNHVHPLTQLSNLHFTVTEEEKAWIEAANKETLRQLEEVEKEVDKAK